MSSEYTTDAMPSPPREEPNENQTKQSKENLETPFSNEEPKKKQPFGFPKYPRVYI